MRVNKTLTVGAAPLNVLTGSVTPDVSLSPVYATRIFVQALHGGTGRGLVLDGLRLGYVPDGTVADDITAELAPATSTAPGGSYSDADPLPAGGIDLRKFWVHGTNAGDLIKVSYDLKV